MNLKSKTKKVSIRQQSLINLITSIKDLPNLRQIKSKTDCSSLANKLDPSLEGC